MDRNSGTTISGETIPYRDDSRDSSRSARLRKLCTPLSMTSRRAAGEPRRPDVSAAIAGADAFIQALPQGYHTRLSGSVRGAGTTLSAGQRQILALARALVHRPAVLLLDEATSAIDSASDAAFRTVLRERVLARGVAVLTVAHRLSSARDADRVIVLEKGRVVEAGPPIALAAGGGRFAAWLELEAAGWDWRSGG